MAQEGRIFALFVKGRFDKNMDIKFSIIIPSLNEEKYLPKLLGDLAKQTLTDFEVIVVDGFSDDETVNRISEFKNKLNSLEIINSEKRNVSYQRNLGAKKAKNEWLIFMDADNRLPDYFFDGIKYRVLKEKPQLFTTHCLPDSNKKGDKVLTDIMNLGSELNNFMEEPTLKGSMVGVRKKIFAKYGGFDETILFAEDKEYVKRLHGKGIKLKVFRDPRYVLSLRHYRRDGLLKYSGKITKLNFKNFAKLSIDQPSEYPMGGAVQGKRNSYDLITLFKSLKTAAKKPKILRNIKRYLNTLESEY